MVDDSHNKNIMKATRILYCAKSLKSCSVRTCRPFLDKDTLIPLSTDSCRKKETPCGSCAVKKTKEQIHEEEESDWHDVKHTMIIWFTSLCVVLSMQRHS